MKVGDKGLYIGQNEMYKGLECEVISANSHTLKVKFDNDYWFYASRANIEPIVEKAQHKEQFNAITPAHYKKGGIDTIDFTSTFFTKEELSGAYRFNVIKYVQRYKDKNGLEDLKKAQFYLDKLVKLEEEHANN